MKIKILVVFLISGLVFVSCQKERYEVLTEEDKNSFSAGSEFYNLVERSAMHNGTADDSVDESPCFSISFPYEMTFEDVEVRIASESDLEFVLGYIARLGIDDFQFRFPLTLTMANFDQVTVFDEEELEEYSEICEMEMEAGLSPITCMDIDFPIKVFVYNINSQMTTSANIANKKQLYVFLENAGEGEVLSFEYPIFLELTDGTEIIVNSNEEFTQVLRTCD